MLSNLLIINILKISQRIHFFIGKVPNFVKFLSTINDNDVKGSTEIGLNW